MNTYNKLKKITSGFVAKTEYASFDRYLPYWMHAVDTMLVASWLTDKLITDQQWENLIRDAGDAELLEKTIQFIALTHDIGKLSSAFQQKIIASLPDYDLPEYSPFFRKCDLTCRHDWIGEMILRELGVNDSVNSVIGAHHGNFQSGEAENVATFYNTYRKCIFGKKPRKDWKSLWRETVDASLEICELDSVEDIPEFSVPNQMLLSGLLIAADWLSSNQYYFPCIDIERKGSDSDYPRRFERGVQGLTFSDPWIGQPGCLYPSEFQSTFGFPPRATQEEVLKIVSDMADPGLLIIEAQMGIGKTEAALSAAEGMAAKVGSGGIYFGLPTQATANALFPRLKNWANHRSFLDYESMTLNHGKAELNPEYAAMIDSAESLEDSPENSSEESHLFVNPWMRRKQLSLLPNFVFGTIDGLLMCALQKKHVALRHLGASAKVIILDEIHAYDAYTNSYLERTLNWLGSYKVPVILLSATLPDERRQALVQSYLTGRLGEKKGKKISIPDSERYPKITWTDGPAVNLKEVEENGIQTHVFLKKVPYSELNLERIQELQKKLNGNGAAGIIVNTVNKAQSLARMIQEADPEQEVIVFHSRFTDADRTRIEQQLLSRIGKESDYSERKGLIVIGTQVLEQSLDIDFDVLFTELAPMDLLLQRIGRLHRHLFNQSMRPEALKEAICYIFGAGDEELDPGSSMIYEPWILEMTRKLLPDTLRLPLDIAPLVRETYRKPEDDSDPIYSKYHLHENQKKTKAVSFQLRTAEEQQNSSDCLDGFFDMQGLSEEQGENSVRDIDDNISVILVRDGGLNRIELISDAEILHSDVPPDQDQTRKLLEQKITLPAAVSYSPSMFRDSVRELEKITLSRLREWQSVPQLKGELFLILDHQNQTRLNGRMISYTKDNGLTVSKEEKEEKEE